MPRPKKTDRPRRFEVCLPESVYARLQLELFSELEGKVPFGAMSVLTTRLIDQWLNSRGNLSN